MGNPHPFFRAVERFLELLAVAHATPLLRLADFAHHTNLSARRLLGLQDRNGAYYQRRSAQAFDGFEAPQKLDPRALAEAKDVFLNRTDKRYESMAPVIGRLSEALTREGRFGGADRILDISIALERMYVTENGKISRKLRGRAARFLATDMESREKICEHVRKFYDVRSDIIHNRTDRLTERKVREAFHSGFDIAQRSLFKLLYEGPPEKWGDLE